MTATPRELRATRKMRRKPSLIGVKITSSVETTFQLNCEDGFLQSLAFAEDQEVPFPHKRLAQVLPAGVIAELAALPFSAPTLERGSGARELNNETRRYLDPTLIASSPSCASVARAFQSTRVVAQIERAMAVELTGCSLRIEHAQDAEGFWLARHTDLGIKRFTLLCYLGPEGQPNLGTDLYDADGSWSARPRFAPGIALAFVPSDRSWHGFEPRPLDCVRKSLIVNYVTDDWRAREQLAFPDAPVTGARAARNGG